MHEEIAIQLTQGATVITANRRLANHWRKEYDLWQSEHGHVSWPTLDALPLDDWLMRTWLATLPSHKLLNQTQSLTLWENIIRQSEFAEYLLQPQATALLAKEAWEIMQLWQIPLSALAQETSLDTQIFVCWTTEYLSQCQQNNWLDQSDLANSLIDSPHLNSIKLPTQILLAGFVNQIPPQLQTLFSKLKSSTQIDYLHLHNLNKQVHRVECLDTATEIRAMARWARLSLEKNPKAKIACVVPELTALRDELIRAFREEFALNSEPAPNRYFNISLGKALSSYPIIQTALLILELDRPRIAMDALSKLLLSPFLGGAELELGPRALLDQHLRKENQLEVHLRKTLALARSSREHINSKLNCPRWVSQIESFLQTTKTTPSLQSPLQWAELFLQQLKKLGWPGDRTLSSEEYQTVKRLQQLLVEFSQLEIVNQKMTAIQAQQKIRSMAQQIIFQPESPETSIQILGVLEATGMQFDQLWLMGLYDQQWPSSSAPNPFIPIRIQRSLGVVQSSPQKVLEYYKTLTDQFSQSATQVKLSYPVIAEDKSLRCSPLIFSYPQVTLEELNLATAKASYTTKHNLLEWIEDIQAPALTNDHSHKGGSKILELQAKCPFKAFAELRLNTTSIESPSLGLTALERGSLLHDALARIWQQLKSSEHLHSLSVDELKTLVSRNIKAVLKDFTHKKPLVFLPQFTQIEQERLENLISGWLEFEKKRPAFVIASIEKAVSINITGIDLSLRIDRIDETSNSEKIVIDYKSGKVSTYDWLEPKPLQIQLPLYACVEPQSVAALALAQIRPEQYKLVGITESVAILPSVDDLTKHQSANKISDWIIQWQQWFKELSLTYQAGFAAVAPKHKQICDNCELKSLCRIHEEEENYATTD